MSVIKPAIQNPVRIAYLTGASNYTWVHFRDGEKTMLAKPINYFETQLTNFIRIHKTALINPACVERLQQPPRRRMAGQVQLVGGITLPVSRRRWNEVTDLLQPYLTPEQIDDEAHLTSESAAADTERKSVGRADAATVSVVLVTDDTQSAEKIRQMVEAIRTQYVLHTLTRSTQLPDLFRLLPDSDRPVLVLLDARTAPSERLQTLQALKQHTLFSRIPVIMFVMPTGNLVADAYAQQANSVIAVPADPEKFVMVVERVCQFWLQRAALPLSVGI